VAGVSSISYILAGFLKTPWLPLGIGVVLLFGILLWIKTSQNRSRVKA